MAILCSAEYLDVTTHIPGSQNVIADKLSRQFEDSLEWKLDVQVFRELCDRLGTPEVDLFATRLNTQLNRFVAWRPDPEAEAVDAFACSGKDGLLYAFSPFCLIGACVQKIVLDSAEYLSAYGQNYCGRRQIIC